MDVDIQCRVSHQRGCVVVTVSGTLDVPGYAPLRDRLLKLVAEDPAALVVDLAGLRVAAESQLSVFVAVWMRTCHWPGVPILLVDPAGVVPRGTALRRYLPVHPDPGSALAAVERAPQRRRAERVLPNAGGSVAAAVAQVRAVCREWGVPPERAEPAAQIACELVTNTLVHTTSEARLRLELHRGLFTVAVGDDDPRRAVLRDPAAAAGGDPGLGLLVVAQLAKAWGCSSGPTAPGKVVWATLAVA
ncbi:ATP-binding protein [Actinokineospora bangkokensis]|uniref:STAS domain-containing protein n=1 Tax=Actinokineospora bangkokensis TaxID=1193682 RepID=A0A1Q9LLM3_9PSEU|nr:ATP-binding protein [Actinokineospora bangkokensis]OLR92936.1 hypothetical protein BJP25_18355 [Actinokineospora bangkokensis]